MKVIVPDIALNEINELGKELAEKIFAILDDVEKLGLSQIPSARKKKLQGEIWEFRVSGKDNIARSLYASIKKDTLCVLVSFVKKTQEVPVRYIKLANERLLRYRKELRL